MPFSVRFNIYAQGKVAPEFTTCDRRLAMVEFNHRITLNGGAFRMVPEITCTDLTKQEQYVWLVYRVRKAIDRYFSHGRKKEDMEVSLALEKELDLWNASTRFYLQGHPRSTPDNLRAFAFFQIVERWRDRWHRYFAYKKRRDKDVAVEREMKKECFALEAEIDKYVKEIIGL